MTPEAGPSHLYVLAGGQSQRFGSDKALAEVAGIPLLRGVIDRLSPTIGHAPAKDRATLVTGQAQRYTALGYPVICDRPSGVGPIGGLAAALHHQRQRGGGWALIASCDLVLPRPQWIGPLIRAIRPGAHAVAYHGERFEPMLALYHTDLLPTVESQVGLGVYAMQRLLSRAASIRVALPEGLTALPQANTPGELRHTLARGGAA